MLRPAVLPPKSKTQSTPMIPVECFRILGCLYTPTSPTRPNQQLTITLTLPRPLNRISGYIRVFSGRQHYYSSQPKCCTSCFIRHHQSVASSVSDEPHVLLDASYAINRQYGLVVRRLRDEEKRAPVHRMTCIFWVHCYRCRLRFDVAVGRSS